MCSDNFNLQYAGCHVANTWRSFPSISKSIKTSKKKIHYGDIYDFFSYFFGWGGIIFINSDGKLKSKLRK